MSQNVSIQDLELLLPHVSAVPVDDQVEAHPSLENSLAAGSPPLPS